MRLSQRLTAVAQMITPGMRVADIGCDHGYLAIYLIKNGISPHVTAMDINRGPLERARQHVTGEGLTDDIDLRLSDGLTELKPEEAECIVMAGMGGPLMTEIMEKGVPRCREASEFILQPQSEVEKVRHYLEDKGYRIVSEDIIFEDGKFYPIIKALHGSMKLGEEVYYRFGKILLKEKHPILRQYLLYEKQQLKVIMDSLLNSPETEKVSVRIIEITHDIEMVNEALRIAEPTFPSAMA